MSVFQAGYFEKIKNFYDSNIDTKITKQIIKNDLLKKKENIINERRKKLMKDIFAKMMDSSIIKKDVDSMEVEEENKGMNNLSNEDNKKKAIQEYLEKQKKIYNENSEEFLYQTIEDNKISFCPNCGYPVMVIDEDLSSKNNEYLNIACVNSCFEFELNKSVFKKYSMDNIMDLYKRALKIENKCQHNDISPISSDNNGITFTCITCLFEQFK